MFSPQVRPGLVFNASRSRRVEDEVLRCIGGRHTDARARDNCVGSCKRSPLRPPSHDAIFVQKSHTCGGNPDGRSLRGKSEQGSFRLLRISSPAEAKQSLCSQVRVQPRQQLATSKPCEKLCSYTARHRLANTARTSGGAALPRVRFPVTHRDGQPLR